MITLPCFSKGRGAPDTQEVADFAYTLRSMQEVLATDTTLEGCEVSVESCTYTSSAGWTEDSRV